MMALIHDIVEIDAGDTYAYNTEEIKTQKDREEAAADRIFGILPQNQRDELIALFEEFEEGKSPEAAFARAMDNFQPLILNNSNNGGDWHEHKVKKSQILKRHIKTKDGSNEIWNYSTEIIEENLKKGNIIDE